MKDHEDRTIYIAMGPLAAILLGFALMPLRDVVDQADAAAAEPGFGGQGDGKREIERHGRVGPIGGSRNLRQRGQRFCSHSDGFIQVAREDR